MKTLILAAAATLALTASGAVAAEQGDDRGAMTQPPAPHAAVKSDTKAKGATKSETTGSGSSMKKGTVPPKDSSNTIKLDNGPKSGEAADRSGSTAVH